MQATWLCGGGEKVGSFVSSSSQPKNTAHSLSLPQLTRTVCTKSRWPPRGIWCTRALLQRRPRRPQPRPPRRTLPMAAAAPACGAGARARGEPRGWGGQRPRLQSRRRTVGGGVAENVRQGKKKRTTTTTTTPPPPSLMHKHSACTTRCCLKARPSNPPSTLSPLFTHLSRRWAATRPPWRWPAGGGGGSRAGARHHLLETEGRGGGERGEG